MKNQPKAQNAQNPQLADYAGLFPNDGKTITVTLTNEEAAAVLAAYDNGIDALNTHALETLEQALASLKFELWS